jgi:N-carbamoylputrescine amidase
MFLLRKKNGWHLYYAYIIDFDGSEAGLYRKMHIQMTPFLRKKFYFTPGDLGFKTIQQKRKNRNINLLGPVVSRGSTPDCTSKLKFYLPNSDRMASGRKRQFGENQHGAWMSVMKDAVANGCMLPPPIESDWNNTCLIREFSSGDLRLLQDHREKFTRHKPHTTKKNPCAEVDLDLGNVRQNWRSSGTDELTLW